MAVKLLVADVGGTHVKLMLSGNPETRKFESGKQLTPQGMVDLAIQTAEDWQYDAVAIGYPGPVHGGQPAVEPKNLAPGWVGFDFGAGFRKPTRLTNDAAMQALGSYDGGRMLFLGLGTGLGSALVVANTVLPLELGQLRYGRSYNYADRVSDEGLARLGQRKWRRAVAEMVARFRGAFRTDYIVIGGGNAKKLNRMPQGARRGDNQNVLLGAERLWEGSSLDANTPGIWKVL